MKHFIIVCICAILSSNVHSQAPYKLKVTRVEVVRCNKAYNEARLWLTKPTRFTTAVNGEFTAYNIPRDTKVKVKLYEFLSNEYRPFAVNLERDLCSFLLMDYKMIIYPDLVKAGAHVPEPRCPMQPGNYSFANVTPNIDNYPPGLPFRNFLAMMASWHGAVEMSFVKAYGTLDRDAVIREQYG